jgi:ubiquinone/menaquinone biosynthesis C-methylase UbiE
MGRVEGSIASDYGEPGLGERIFARLQAFGIDTEHLTQEILSEIDHIHGGGYANTVDHTKLVDLEDGMRVLDVGCGIGGPARYFAKVFGCRVTGIDLTEEYVAVAAMLTERCGLTDQANFQCANAIDLPFEDSCFDAVFCLNVSMNIEERRQLYGQVARVLKPGGQLAWSELGQGPGGEPYYPLPWARDASYSFLVPPVELRAGLETAGFQIKHWIDEAQRRKEVGGRVSETASTTKPVLPPGEGNKMVRGDDYPDRQANSGKSVMEDRLTNVKLVANLAF